MSSPARIYRVTAADTCLRQGEILSDLILFRLDVATIGESEPGVVEVRYPFVVVMTQDCDLEQDFKARSGINKGDKLLPEVLFCQVATAAQLRGTQGLTSEMWRRISQNKDERYHFLQKTEPAYDTFQEGLPELGIDFKKYFTLPADEVYRRVEVGPTRRRCIIVSPYLEHFSSRFAYFMSRVALPEDHFSEPGGARKE